MNDERVQEVGGAGGLSTADLAAATAQQNQMREEMPPVVTPDNTPLLNTGANEQFRTRWEAIQTGFVDEPRRAVEQADGLVAEAIQQLAASFAEERNKLESQWAQGDNISTEDLRVALQRYRSFFERLLAV